ncbi:MAG: hypothetical protein V4683_07310 [Bacteroidota bacterium]
MRINKILFCIAVSLIFSFQIVAQDSTNVQDPQPVVITQEGYTPEVVEPEVPLSEMSFAQRLKYGGSFGPFSFSSFQTVIGLSPMIGYKLTEHTIVGAGASVIFWRLKDPYSNTKEKSDLLGYSGFIRQDLLFTQKLNFPLYITAEVLQFQGIQIKGKYKPAFLAGLGMGNAGSYGLQVLWDFNYDVNSSFSGSFSNSPLVIRVTGFFN